jgi:ubiquinone/menaquinone biosynthesis C-methylase UbiE
MATVKPASSNYTLGHDEATLKAHQARTAHAEAAYLLPHVEPHHHILDVGCGPGTITLGLAERARDGRAVGIDYSSTAVEAAQKAAGAAAAPANVEFRVGNAYALAWEEATFDIVHAHQCLIHLAEPVRALREMRRVCKTSGWVGVREGKPRPAPRRRVRAC